MDAQLPDDLGDGRAGLSLQPQPQSTLPHLRRVLALCCHEDSPWPGICDDVTFATKPEQDQAMIGRAVAGGVPIRWATGDETYSPARQLRCHLPASGSHAGGSRISVDCLIV
jgi:hypothetical protein